MAEREMSDGGDPRLRLFAQQLRHASWVRQNVSKRPCHRTRVLGERFRVRRLSRDSIPISPQSAITFGAPGGHYGTAVDKGRLWTRLPARNTSHHR